MPAVLAVDWGATSIRVCRVDLDAERPPEIDVAHRYAHEPVRHGDGSLRWDFDRLMDETRAGLRAGLARGPVASIGVDTWGVDYGLLDDRGELVAPPFAYRDTRTDGYAAVLGRIGAAELYGRCGLQVLPFTTVFQLAAHRRDELDRAARIALLPDLVVDRLCGTDPVAELTMAGTTGLLDLATRTWSPELIDAIDVDPALFPPLAPPGTAVGSYEGVPVHLVGGHDTASAVAGGAAAGAAYVSAGTWLLVGDERDDPDLSEGARARNMTNELGVDGRIRFLRNVAGWWLVEECRRRWGADLGALLDAAAGHPGDVPTFDATDDRFLAPDDMPAEIVAAAGLAPDADRATIVRCAIESMAETTADLVAWLGSPAIRVFGGGAQSPLFLDALRRRSGLPVSVGPVEATALGSALVQGLALGVFPDLATARLVTVEGGPT